MHIKQVSTIEMMREACNDEHTEHVKYDFSIKSEAQRERTSESQQVVC